jgi:hypothetical protein
LFLRIFDYQGLTLMEKDPLLAQKYKPHYDGEIFDPEAQKKIEIKINSLGFRDADHSIRKADSKRILFLGDSFVAGLAVPFEQTFPRVVQSILDSNSHRWEAFNFGVAGFGTAQEMLAYERYGREFHPDFVILCFFAGNDVSDNSSQLSSNPRIYFHLDQQGNLVQENVSKVRSGIASFLNDHSRFYLWQKNQMRKLEFLYKTKVALNPADRVYLSDYDDRMLRAWNITRALIGRLNSEARRDGAQLLILYIPSADEVNPDWWKESLLNSPPMRNAKWDLSKPESVLQSICRDSGIDFLSPRSVFLKEGTASNRFYFKHGHLNENGHHRLAQLITEKLL